MAHVPSCSLFPTQLAVSLCVNDATNLYYACSHSLFCHGRTTISVLAGILTEKNMLYTINHDHPNQHVSQVVDEPKEPIESKTKSLLFPSEFHSPLSIVLHIQLYYPPSQSCNAVRNTKHTSFNLESIARH